jgi:hypothetical protein
MYSISAYQISVSTLKDVPIPIKTAIQIAGGSQSLFKTFYDGISKTTLPLDLKDDKKVVQFYTPIYDASHDSLWGKIGTGEYGYTSDIYDPNAKKIAYKKPKNQAGMLPFYYYFKPSKNPNIGILVVQKFKQFGIKTFLHQQLMSHLLAIHADAKISIEKVIPTTLIQKLLTQGEVRSLRLIKEQVPKDICDQLDKVDPAKQAEQMEIIIKVARGGSFSGLAIFDAFKSKQLNGLITIPNYSYDDIKVDVDFSGKKRVISLGHPGRLAGNIDITEELDIGSDGHPEENNLKKIMADFAKEILK